MDKRCDFSYNRQSYSEWLKDDADLVNSFLQYVLGVLHQLLHLSEHVVQTDWAPLQNVPQGNGAAAAAQQADRDRE